MYLCHDMKKWIQAARLRTLPLALACVGMGAILAKFEGLFDWLIFSFLVLTTMLLQVLSNFANDYGDFVNGADNNERTGPPRLVQSGDISAKAMKNAIVLFSILSFISGLLLLYYSVGFHQVGFYIFLGFGVLAIYAAITYTAGKNPYGYIGLGDISVFLFFGLLGVLGSAYLFTGGFNPINILPAISCGFFSTAVLNLNNIRDIESDLKAGKKSIPVRIGREAAVKYHIMLIVLGVLCALVFMLINYQSVIQFVFVLVVPLFFRNVKAVQNFRAAEKLDPFLKQLAISTLIFVILFGFALLSRT
jgi:1,4-dihydroxy-2-naphthoate polyprenyltransferase